MKTYMVIFLRSPQLYSKRQLRLAGHCYRSDETVAKLILWKPKHCYRRPGRPRLDYVTLLTQETGLTCEELCTAMSNRKIWRNYVDSGWPDWWWWWWFQYLKMESFNLFRQTLSQCYWLLSFLTGLDWNRSDFITMYYLIEICRAAWETFKSSMLCVAEASKYYDFLSRCKCKSLSLIPSEITPLERSKWISLSLGNLHHWI